MKFNVKGIYKDYNDLIIEDIYYLVEKDPWTAVKHLNKHPLLNQQHVDYLMEKAPWIVAECLSKHPLLNQQHIDYLVEKEPWYAVRFLKHRLTDENLEYLATNHSEEYEELFT